MKGAIVPVLVAAVPAVLGPQYDALEDDPALWGGWGCGTKGEEEGVGNAVEVEADNDKGAIKGRRAQSVVANVPSTTAC